MKPSMIFAIVMLTVIVMISAFDLQLSPGTELQIPAGIDAANVLYVCPINNESGWTALAFNIRPFLRYIMIFLTSCGIILLFVWMWALYQNLLKDKFEREKFVNPWKFTKILFWAFVVVLVISVTPNYFKTVHVRNVSGDFVLCESDSPGAKLITNYHDVTR